MRILARSFLLLFFLFLLLTAAWREPSVRRFALTQVLLLLETSIHLKVEAKTLDLQWPFTLKAEELAITHGNCWKIHAQRARCAFSPLALATAHYSLHFKARGLSVEHFEETLFQSESIDTITGNLYAGIGRQSGSLALEWSTQEKSGKSQLLFAWQKTDHELLSSLHWQEESGGKTIPYLLGHPLNGEWAKGHGSLQLHTLSPLREEPSCCFCPLFEPDTKGDCVITFTHPNIDNEPFLAGNGLFTVDSSTIRGSIEWKGRAPLQGQWITHLQVPIDLHQVNVHLEGEGSLSTYTHTPWKIDGNFSGSPEKQQWNLSVQSTDHTTLYTHRGSRRKERGEGSFQCRTMLSDEPLEASLNCSWENGGEVVHLSHILFQSPSMEARGELQLIPRLSHWQGELLLARLDTHKLLDAGQPHDPLTPPALLSGRLSFGQREGKPTISMRLQGDLAMQEGWRAQGLDLSMQTLFTPPWTEGGASWPDWQANLHVNQLLWQETDLGTTSLEANGTRKGAFTLQTQLLSEEKKIAFTSLKGRWRERLLILEEWIGEWSSSREEQPLHFSLLEPFLLQYKPQLSPLSSLKLGMEKGLILITLERHEEDWHFMAHCREQEPSRWAALFPKYKNYLPITAEEPTKLFLKAKGEWQKNSGACSGSLQLATQSSHEEEPAHPIKLSLHLVPLSTTSYSLEMNCFHPEGGLFTHLYKPTLPDILQTLSGQLTFNGTLQFPAPDISSRRTSLRPWTDAGLQGQLLGIYIGKKTTEETSRQQLTQGQFSSTLSWTEGTLSLQKIQAHVEGALFEGDLLLDTNNGLLRPTIATTLNPYRHDIEQWTKERWGMPLKIPFYLQMRAEGIWPKLYYEIDLYPARDLYPLLPSSNTCKRRFSPFAKLDALTLPTRGRNRQTPPPLKPPYSEDKNLLKITRGRVKGLYNSGQLEGNLLLQGALRTIASPRTPGTIRTRSRKIPLQVSSHYHMKEHLWQIRQILASLGKETLRGALSISPKKEWKGSFRANLRNINRKIDPQMPGGTAELSTQFFLGTTTFNAKLQVTGKGLAFAKQRCKKTQLTIQASGPYGAAKGSINATMEDLFLAGMTLSEVQIDAHLLPKGGTWNCQLLTKDPSKVTFSGSWKSLHPLTQLIADERSPPSSTETIPLLTWQLEKVQGLSPTRSLHLDTPFQLTWNGKRWSFTPLRLKVGQGSFLLDLTDRNHAAIDVKDFPLELLSTLYGEQYQLEGAADLLGSFSTEGETPEGTCTVECRDLHLVDRFLTKSPHCQVHCTLSLHQRETKRTLGIEGTLLCSELPTISPLIVHAEIPLLLSLSPWKCALIDDHPWNIEAQGAGPLAPLLDLFFNDISSIDGSITTHLSARGTPEKPLLEGNIVLKEGRYENLDSGILLQGIEGTATFSENQLHIENLRGNDGDRGNWQSKGTLSLSTTTPFTYDIEIALRDLWLVRLDHWKTACSGTMNLHGDLQKGLLSGTLETTSASLQIPKELSENIETLPILYGDLPENSYNSLAYLLSDQQTITESFPIQLDLLLKTDHRLHIDGEGLSSSWSGQAKLTGTLNSPKAQGELKLKQGRYLYNGKTFELTQGTIFLTGPIETKTNLYIIARTEIDDIAIETILRGPIKDPNISFRSNPAMPQREILSRLLFGKASTEVTPGEEGLISRSLSTLNQNASPTPNLLTKVRTTLGIDRIDISQSSTDGSDQVSLQVGKYLSPGVYVSLNKSISGDSNSMSIEAKLVRHLKARAEVTDDAETQLLLKWKNEY